MQKGKVIGNCRTARLKDKLSVNRIAAKLYVFQEYAVKIPDTKKKTMATKMISLLSELPKEAVKTITYDQGEFVCGRKIGKTLQCDMFRGSIPCMAERNKRKPERTIAGILS